MKKLFFLLLIPSILVGQQSEFHKVHWTDSSNVIVPVPPGKSVKIKNLGLTDTARAASVADSIRNVVGQSKIWNGTFGITGTLSSQGGGKVIADSLKNLITYKRYIAIIQQAGTSAPTEVAVLDNTIGSIAWHRQAAGDYYAVLTNAFTSNKTWALTQDSKNNGVITTFNVASVDSIRLISFVAGSGSLIEMSTGGTESYCRVSILVYP